MASTGSGDIDKFLNDVNEIENIVKSFRSEDDVVAKEAMQKADKLIAKVQKQKSQLVSKANDEDGLPETRTGFSKTSINKTAFAEAPGSDEANYDNLDQAGFMKVLEADAAERAQRRKARQKVANELKEKGNEEFKQGHYEKALDFYTQALSEVKDNTVLYTNRAQTYIKLEKYQEAIGDCDWALRAFENCLKAHIHMGRAYLGLKEYQKARDCYNNALKCDPKKENMVKDYLAEVDRVELTEKQEKDAEELFTKGNMAETGLVEVLERTKKLEQLPLFYSGGFRVLKSLMNQTSDRTLFRTNGGIAMLTEHAILCKCLAASPKSLSQEELDMLTSAFDMYKEACRDNDLHGQSSKAFHKGCCGQSGLSARAKSSFTVTMLYKLQRKNLRSTLDCFLEDLKWAKAHFESLRDPKSATDAPTALATDAPTTSATDAPTTSATDAPTTSATDAPKTRSLENGYTRSYDSLKKTCEECDLVALGRITSVSMRKYTATLTQMLNLKSYQLEWMCRHLGHTTDVHKTFYRHMSGYVERVQLSKLFLLQDLNLTAKFKGKSLDEIDITELIFPQTEESVTGSVDEDTLVNPSDRNEATCDFDEVVFEAADSENEQSEDNAEVLSVEKTKELKPKTQKPKRQTWTSVETKEMEEYFKSYLDSKICPRKTALVAAKLQSKKRGGKIWLRSNDKIVKKISAMNHKENYDSRVVILVFHPNMMLIRLLLQLSEKNTEMILHVKGLPSKCTRFLEVKMKGQGRLLKSAIVNFLYVLSQLDIGQRSIVTLFDISVLLSVLFTQIRTNTAVSLAAASLLNNLALDQKFKSRLKDTIDETVCSAFELLLNETGSQSVLPQCITMVTNLTAEPTIRSNLSKRKQLWDGCLKLLANHKDRLSDQQSVEILDSVLGLLLNLTSEVSLNLRETGDNICDNCQAIIKNGACTRMLLLRGVGLMSHVLPHCIPAVDVVVVKGGTDILLQYCRETTEEPEPKKSALKCLTAMTQINAEARQFVVDNKGLGALMKLLKSDDEVVVGNAALCLSHCTQVKKVCAVLTGTEIIKELLVLARDGKRPAVQQNCAILIAKLAQGDSKHLERLRELHGIEILHSCMKYLK